MENKRRDRFRWPVGNRLDMCINLRQITVTDGGTQFGDYIPSAAAVVKVWLVGNYASFEYDPRIDGSKLYITDNGELKVGVYAIDVRVQEPERKLRSLRCGELEIVRETRQLALGDFILDNNITLDADAFVFGEGPSAYEVAVRDGYTGTKAEWLESLRGKEGRGIADIVPLETGAFRILLTDGSAYITPVLKGEQGVSIVDFTVSSITSLEVICMITMSDGTTHQLNLPRGEQGAKGDKGDDGQDGRGIQSVVLNADYTLTFNYTDGTTFTTPQALRGEKGDNGQDGQDGQDGRGISSMAIDDDNHLTVSYTDGTSYTTPQSLQGERGVSITDFEQVGENATMTFFNIYFSNGNISQIALPKGEQGDRGETGPQGPKGDTVVLGEVGEYKLYNVGGTATDGAMTQDATTKAIAAASGYYECSTAAGTAAKVAVGDNEALYSLQKGGSIKVKMTNANAAASGVTMKIGSAAATPLYYNGEAVSASNTWEAGEVIEVYYDGTNYQATNAKVGSGKAADMKYDNSQSGFASDNVQGALDEVSEDIFVEGDAIDLGTKYECVIYNSSKAWVAQEKNIARTCRIISVSEGQKYKIYGRTTIRAGQSEPDASVYAWLTTDSHVIGEMADYVPGYESNLTVPPYIGTVVTAPQGAKYMYVAHNVNDVPRLPRQIVPLLSARDSIETLNGSVYGKGYNNGSSITITSNDTAYMYTHSGWMSNISTKCQFIPINNAVSFKITANAEQGAVYAFVTRIREEGDVVGALCPTDRNIYVVSAGETALTTVIPEGAEYLYIGITDGNGRNHAPESIVVYTDKMEASDGNVEDIAEINSQLLINSDEPIYAVGDTLDIAKCLMRHGVVGDEYLKMLYGNDKSHHLLIPTGNASEFTIVGNASNNTNLVWLSSDEYEYDKTVPLAPGEASKHPIPAGETTVMKIPAGTRFMAINVDSTENEDARPESITVTGIVSKFTPNKDWKTDKIDDNRSSIKALLGNYDAADGELNLNINELGKDGGIFVQWYYPHVMSTNCIHKRIYYTFCDEKGSTGVGCINSFDHRSWRTVLKRVLTTNNGERKPDVHNTACVQMLPDRRFICFYTEGHSSTPYMLYRITKRPEDITEWEDVVSLRFNCSNVTYCQYHYINGRHYVFTRIDVLKWGYVYSDDLVTWSDLNIFVTSNVQYYMLLKPIDGTDKKLRFIMYSNPHYNDRAIRSGIIDFETGNVYDYDGVTLKGTLSDTFAKEDFTILVPDINTNYTQRMHDLAVTDADTIRITYSRAYSRYGNGTNKNKYFVYEWNRGDAASGSITDLGEAGEIVVGHNNTFNCSGAFFIDKDRLFVQKSSQNETGDDWTELWTRTDGVWSMTKELYREQKYCFDETDPSNNRVRNFYPHVDCNHKFVLWCRGKYGITDYYNAVSDVMVYDVEKDEIF